MRERYQGLTAEIPQREVLTRSRGRSGHTGALDELEVGSFHRSGVEIGRTSSHNLARPLRRETTEVNGKATNIHDFGEENR